MNPRYPMKRLPSEPTRVSVSTLRSTPNFKASHTTHTDEHTESDYSQEIPFAHKSFDVSTGLTSRAFLKPNTSNIQQRRPSSGKKERPTEPVRGGSFDALLSGPDSHRKTTKPTTTTNPVNKDIMKTFQHKISEMAAAAATSQRSLSQRDKPFFAVPITDLNRKNSQEIRPQIGSSRDRDRTEEEYSTRIANLESFTLSPTKVLGRYQSLVKSYEELMNRNKQAEESLRLEVIRGEEQRAYIEMLKRVIEENKNKPCQFCILREQKHSQDGHRSDRKSDNILNTEVESLRANEGRLIQDIETFRDRLQDANTEKEMMVAQLGHSQETVDKLNSEIRRLKESLLVMQKEASKVKEENSVLTEQFKQQGSVNECEKLRKELKELQSNYEDLKVLSGEIENQRKMGTKMLEEEIRERRKAEVENKDMREKLNQVDNVIEVKEKEKAELEKMVEEERMLVKELQQKLEVLEDNYSTLRMTLNENENELEKLKSEQENSKENEEEVNRLQEENSKLKEKLEEVQKSMAEEKARLRNGYESNQKRLSKLSEDLRSAYSTNEKVMEECQLLKSEKNILFQKVENLEEAQRKSQRNSMVLGGSSNASDIVKKYEDRERVLRMLKDQVNLLEKENSLLKNSQETSRQRSATTEKMKEENVVLQQRNEVITKKFQELKAKWELLRTEHSQVLHEVGQLREDIGRIEGELTEIIETYLPQEDLIDTGALSAREITEEDYGRISRLMQNVKKKIERLNERYNQAKLDLVREMERCVEIERENDKESVLKRENMVLREKLERMSQEFVEMDKEKSLLKISNENLLQKFSHVNMQVQTLKKELEGMHNKENHIISTRKSLIDHSDPINSDIKLKDAMIKRLEAFVFNLDVKELLEEMLHIETRILKLSKTKEKVPLRHSMRSTSTLDPTERKENSFLESRSTMKGDVDDMNEELELQKAKRDTLENELSKLEEQERKRYDSLSTLEKQNFELKSEISRLMTELEINFSEYKDSKSEYYSRKMNERFMFSNGGYDFALEGLEHKGHKDGTISDFHMDYSMEKISGEDAEDPYYS